MRFDTGTLSLFYSFLLLSTAQDIPCTVTQDAGQTHYTVPEFSATSCHYLWSNGTNHVVANQEAKNEDLVVTKSSVTLITNKCLELIHYKRDCISEGISCEATCTITCIGNAELRHGRGIRHHYWIAVIFALLLLVGLVLCIGRHGKRCFNTEAEHV